MGTIFAVTDPMELAGHIPFSSATNQAGGTPSLRLDAVGGWALRSVVSIIRTSGSAASDADNSEKIRSNHIMGPDPREHLEPPQQSEGIRLGVNWDGKGGSEGAAVGLQRLGAWLSEEADQQGEVPL